MANTYPRISRIHPAGAPWALTIDWENGERDTVDLTGVIARVPAFKPLEDAALFHQVEVVAFGDAIGWPGNLDYGADTLHMLAEEQRPMTGTAFKRLIQTIGLSTGEIADILGVAPSTIKNYVRAERVPAHVAIAMRAIVRDPTVLRAHFRPKKAGRPRKTA